MSRTNRKKVRSAFKWILWVLLIQFLLINISAILYAYKLTHFYSPSLAKKAPSKNIFTKTWKLFRGPKFKKTIETNYPHFPYETVQLITGTGNVIESWSMRSDSSKGSVILIHGLGANKAFMLDQAYEFRYLGYNVMLVDLRAHGNSDGNTTTLGVRESEEVKLAYDYLTKKGDKKIILYGISLGAVVAAKAVHDFQLQPSSIILDMPFGNLQKLLEGRARMLGFPEEPFGMLVTFWCGAERGFNGFRHTTSRYVQTIKCPVLIQYGALDKLVTPEEINCVFKHVASNNKKLVIYEDAGHESFLVHHPERWRQEISDFLRR